MPGASAGQRLQEGALLHRVPTRAGTRCSTCPHAMRQTSARVVANNVNSLRCLRFTLQVYLKNHKPSSYQTDTRREEEYKYRSICNHDSPANVPNKNPPLNIHHVKCKQCKLFTPSKHNAANKTSRPFML